MVGYNKPETSGLVFHLALIKCKPVENFVPAFTFMHFFVREIYLPYSTLIAELNSNREFQLFAYLLATLCRKEEMHLAVFLTTKV